MQEIEQFKRQNDLSGEDSPSEGATAAAAYPDEIDLRAEDDELIATELEAAMEAERVKAEADAAEAAERAAAGEGEDDEDGDGAGDGDGGPVPARRRRSRRGRRSSTRAGAPLEGTFDHGEEGYGLWLDPAIQDNPVYAEHWAGHRPVEVTVEEDRIVIRRGGSEG